MPIITLAGAQDALNRAYNMWLDQNPGEFQVNIEGQAANIIFQVAGNRLDFGFPNIWTLDRGLVGTLANWWASLDRRNRMLDAQWEPATGQYKINAVLYPDSPEGVTLNFHIPLTPQ